MSIKTQDIELAVMHRFDPIKNIVVPNVYRSLLPYEADIVVLRPSGYATEIEIKTSISDFNADFEKKHYHNSPLFKYLYYAVPIEMKDYVLENVEYWVGVITVEGGKLGPFGMEVWIERYAKPKPRGLYPEYVKWTDAQRLRLAEIGTERLFRAKEQLWTKERGYGEID